jgi:phospholipid/cholesterol/gamma-HCH transport system substrate-binding protein
VKGRLPTPRSDRAAGLIGAALTLLLLIAVFSQWVNGLLTSTGNRTLRATFADTRQLESGDPVRIDGVNIGTVDTLALLPARHVTIVTMKLTDSAGPLYGDASAHIRWRILLGGTFYVDLVRGSPSAGAIGSGPIPMSRTDSQVELDDITSVIDGQAKLGLQRFPGQLAVALGDPRFPASTLQTLADSSPSLTAGLSAVRGLQPNSDVRTLINAADTTIQALDRPYGQLRQLVSGTASFVQATGAHTADLQNALAAAPPLMDRANSTMTALDTTLGLVNPLLVKLRAPAPVVAPTVRDLRATVVPTNTLLGRAVPLLHQLRPAVQSLASASSTALPMLGELTPSIDLLANRIVPYMAAIQPDSKHSMAQMIGPGLTALGVIAGYADNAGRMLRFPATSGSAVLYLPCQTYFGSPDSKQAIACQSIGNAVKQAFGAKVVFGSKR